MLRDRFVFSTRNCLSPALGLTLGHCVILIRVTAVSDCALGTRTLYPEHPRSTPRDGHGIQTFSATRRWPDGKEPMHTVRVNVEPGLCPFSTGLRHFAAGFGAWHVRLRFCDRDINRSTVTDPKNLVCDNRKQHLPIAEKTSSPK